MKSILKCYCGYKGKGSHQCPEWALRYEIDRLNKRITKLKKKPSQCVWCCELHRRESLYCSTECKVEMNRPVF